MDSGALPPAVHRELPSRKGSFIKKRATLTSVAAAKTTVSNQRFVFHQAEESQSNTGEAWAKHLKSQDVTLAATAAGSSGSPLHAPDGKKRPATTLSTALWTSLAVNRFKKSKI